MLEAWNLEKLGKGRSVGTEIVLEIDNEKFASLAAHVLSAFPPHYCTNKNFKTGEYQQLVKFFKLHSLKSNIVCFTGY